MVNYRLSEGTPALKQVNIPMDDCKVEQVYSLEEIMGGDGSGTTDTDSETHGNYGEGSGYTTIYRKY
jgi:hypothetical protein